MIPAMWTVRRDNPGPAKTLRLRFYAGDECLSYADFLRALAEEATFRKLIQEELRAAPFGAFHRSAPHSQQHAFWIAVVQAVQARLGSQPLWLNTAGGGVDWLHMRLDGRPKYYRHLPWREWVQET
jgi:hypothetical protein